MNDANFAINGYYALFSKEKINIVGSKILWK